MLVINCRKMLKAIIFIGGQNVKDETIKKVKEYVGVP